MKANVPYIVRVTIWFTILFAYDTVWSSSVLFQDDSKESDDCASYAACARSSVSDLIYNAFRKILRSIAQWHNK